MEGMGNKFIPSDTLEKLNGLMFALEGRNPGNEEIKDDADTIASIRVHLDSGGNQQALKDPNNVRMFEEIFEKYKDQM